MKKKITAAMTALLMTLTAVPFAASAAEAAPKETTTCEDTAENQSCNHTDFFIVKMPDKTEYSIGEELDLTGGTAFACGVEDDLCWDAFEQPMTFYKVDASEFDNTKPGTYTIRLICDAKIPAEVSFPVTVGQKSTGSDLLASKSLLGDVNGDGIVDVMDLILLNKYIVGSANLSQEALAAADMNNDGSVNATDSLLLLKQILA